MTDQPAAFMSYARSDDRYAQLTAFRERLSGAVKEVTGEEFRIFQDRDSIAWGENWEQRIHDALDAATLLLVIITPGFFDSTECSEEVNRFLYREKKLDRADLILPVYWLTSPALEDRALHEAYPLARDLALRQCEDWRELRFAPATSPAAREAVTKLATSISDTFRRPQASPPARAPESGSMAGSPAQGTERAADAKAEPTHVVGPFPQGDFATVSEAIKAARPGDRILVRPGHYQESLVIDKDLVILGDGPVADIQISARHTHTVVFRASNSRIANLTLRQTGGEGRWYGVDITRGRLELEGCHITSRSSACVAIHGGANPRLRGNRIHHGAAAGVYVYDDGLGTLEDNDITANALAGVEITTGGDPTLTGNRIDHGKDAGVYVHDDGLGTLENNDITANALAGVAIGAGGDPTLRRNRIHHGKDAGVYVHDDGRGTLEDNDITANARAGVVIRDGAEPRLLGNLIHDGKQSGVCIYFNGLGTLEDNDITANALAGVEITTGGDPTLSGNRIHHGKDAGVYVHDDGRGTLENNDITDNALAGVTIGPAATPH